MLNPEIEQLLRAIDQLIYSVAAMKYPNKQRIALFEGKIRSKRMRISQIESEAKEGNCD